MVDKIVSVLLIIVAAICAFVFFPRVLASYKPEKLLVVKYYGKRIEVINEKRLITLLTQYADIGEDRFTDQVVTDDGINACGKMGLNICFEMRDGIKIPVSGYQSDVNAKKIYALDNVQKWLVVCVGDIKIVLTLTEAEIGELYRCLDIK